MKCWFNIWCSGRLFDYALLYVLVWGCHRPPNQKRRFHQTAQLFYFYVPRKVQAPDQSTSKSLIFSSIQCFQQKMLSLYGYCLRKGFNDFRYSRSMEPPFSWLLLFDNSPTSVVMAFWGKSVAFSWGLMPASRSFTFRFCDSWLWTSVRSVHTNKNIIMIDPVINLSFYLSKVTSYLSQFPLLTRISFVFIIMTSLPIWSMIFTNSEFIPTFSLNWLKRLQIGPTNSAIL